MGTLEKLLERSWRDEDSMGSAAARFFSRPTAVQANPQMRSSRICVLWHKMWHGIFHVALALTIGVE